MDEIVYFDKISMCLYIDIDSIWHINFLQHVKIIKNTHYIHVSALFSID